MSQMKNYCIEVDGLDRAGKGMLIKYLDLLGKHKYVLMDRGLMSNITFSRIHDRGYEYDAAQFKDWIFVYLFCDEEDWNIRCKIDHEPKIDYTKHLIEFNKTYDMFSKAGFKVMTANTSHVTPYDLAKEIIRQIEDLNKAEQILALKNEQQDPKCLEPACEESIAETVEDGKETESPAE